MKPVLSFLRQAVALCFPPVCLACNERIPAQRMWICGNCAEKLSLMPENRCDKCSTPLREGWCPNCAEGSFVFQSATSVFLYDGVAKELIHKLKYGGYTGIAAWFAAQMHLSLEKEKSQADIDVLTCVPLHRVKQRERGFNQSGLIAQALAMLMGVPYDGNLLQRRANSMSQTRLDGASRRKNLHLAFESGKSGCNGKTVLLVDDVFTTGTTVNEAAKVLLAAGAVSVYVHTVCHGM